MKNHKLNREEQELLDAFESGEFVSDLSKERRAFLSQAAKEAFKKDKRQIRISSRDLEALKRRALEEGTPYQTLISSILHKYVSGGLKNIPTGKASHQKNQMSLK